MEERNWKSIDAPNYNDLKDLLIDIVADNKFYDVREVITDENFQKYGLVLALAMKWGTAPESIIGYCLKYGEDTVNWVLRKVLEKYEEKHAAEEKEQKEKQEETDARLQEYEQG